MRRRRRSELMDLTAAPRLTSQLVIRRKQSVSESRRSLCHARTARAWRLIAARPPRSADLKDVEADNDTAVNGIRALVGIDGAVGLLRGEPGGDDIT